MITINLDGMVAFEQMINAFGERSEKAAILAINQTTKREALSRVRRDMRQQVNFKANYLNSKEHTGVAYMARKGSLRAAIYARDQPTMLNRFRPNPNSVPTRTKRGKNKGVTVRVKPNSTKVMKGAFVHQFNGSKNIGVLLRTKGGVSDPPKGINAGGGRYIASMRAWLLYAPSIDQVMWDTAARNRDNIATYLKAEFLRQFARLK